MSILAVYFILMLYLIEIPNRVEADIPDSKIDDLAVLNNWLITRNMWLATAHNNTEKTDEYDPLRLVIVTHTVSSECHTFVTCAAELRNIQSYFLKSFDYDIPYNFIIGNDGRVYEGRGWNKVGAHTLRYNRCTLGLAFVGDYREEVPYSSRVTALQQARAQMLFEEGIKLGHLHPNFHVLGAKDLQLTISPGSNLYKAIKNWPNYDHQNRYRHLTCDEINKL